MLDELRCQAETLKQDALHLQTSIDTARRRLEAEHGDLMGCIQTDMMAGSSTLCYSMLEASGVSADDAIANKAGAPTALSFCPHPRPIFSASRSVDVSGGQRANCV